MLKSYNSFDFKNKGMILFVKALENLGYRASRPIFFFLQNIFSKDPPAYKMVSVPTSAAPVLGHFLGPCSRDS